MMNPQMIFFDPYPKGLNEYQQRSQKPFLFMKYFPKYLRNLTINSTCGAVKSKVKRVKVIHELKGKEYLTKGSHWRLLLSNKMKTVKTLCNSSQSTIQFVEKFKLFSGLKSIQLTPLDGYDYSDHYLRKKINKKMLSLPKLKSLTIYIDEFAAHHFCLLEDLHSLPKLLKSLKTLNIHFTAPEDQFPTLVEVMKNNNNILQYMTSFTIARLSAPEQHQAFKSLADSCPNLRHLSFEFSCRYIYNRRGRGKYYSETRLPAHANCLRILKTFSNLKSLDLKIADNEAFLSHFVLPPGVQSLSLEFEEELRSETLRQVNGLLLDKEAQLFEDNPNLTKFFENFERLENLTTLKLVLSEDSDPDNYANQNELSRCILKRLSSLRKFTLAVKKSDREQMRWEYEPPVEDSSLNQLLESCSQTLDTLEIDTFEKVLYSKYDFSSLQGKFGNLKTIKFNGSFSDDAPELIGAFLKQLVSLGNSVTTIEFTVLFGREEFFLGLFDELAKVKIPNQLKVKMRIEPSAEPYGYSCYEWPHEQVVEQKIYPKFRGISLAIFTFFESWHMTEFLKSFADRFDDFKIIHKSTEWSPYERWIWP